MKNLSVLSLIDDRNAEGPFNQKCVQWVP